MSQFRTKQILVSSAVFEALKVIAEIEGLDCPDALADLELGKLLNNRGQIEWAKNRARQMRTEFQREYHDRLHAVQTGIQESPIGYDQGEAKQPPSTATQEAPEPVLPERGAGQSKARLDDRP